MTRIRFVRSIARNLSAATLALCVLSTGAILVGPASAQPASEEETLSARADWQSRYRNLLQNRETMRGNIAKLQKYYAQAQRRNYPRGGARQQILIDTDKAEKELAQIELEIEAIFVDARAEGIPPGWLYEVEDEPIAPTPAASAPDEDPEDREGRNPIYFEDDEEAEKDR